MALLLYLLHRCMQLLRELTIAEALEGQPCFASRLVSTSYMRTNFNHTAWHRKCCNLSVLILTGGVLQRAQGPNG